MSATGAFGMEGVDRAALEGSDGILDEAALVERVGVDHHLHVVVVGHREAVVDGGRGRAPVLMELQAGGAGEDHFLERSGDRGIALAGESQVHGESIEALDHAFDMPGAGAGSCQGAMGGAGAAAEHGGDAAHQRFFDLLWRDEMDMGVHAARGQDAPLASDCLGGRADDDVDARLGVGIARLADGSNHPIPEADIGLIDAGVVDDEGVGDDGINRTFRARALRLAHSVPYDLAAAELHLLAIGGEILLDFDEELSIRKADPVARGRAVHISVSGARNACGHRVSVVGCDRGFPV